MSEKRVLVIEGDYESVTELPGKLLAEFDGEIEVRTKGCAYGRVVARRIDDIATLRAIWTKNPNVHFLILGEK